MASVSLVLFIIIIACIKRRKLGSNHNRLRLKQKGFMPIESQSIDDYSSSTQNIDDIYSKGNDLISKMQMNGYENPSYKFFETKGTSSNVVNA
jgi:hypothetical protein